MAHYFSENKDTRLHVQFYEKDTLMAEMDFDPIKREVYDYICYTDKYYELPFGINKNPDYFRFEEYLKTRSWNERRPDMSFLLEHHGLTRYDPLAIVMKTHGLAWGDFKWMKFNTDPENLDYDKIKIRND